MGPPHAPAVRHAVRRAVAGPRALPGRGDRRASAADRADHQRCRHAGVRACDVARRRLPGCPFAEPASFVFGTVGRLQAVKNQALLARAFVRLLEIAPDLRERVRLVIVGEGPTRVEITRILADANASALAWLPGARDDVAQALRSFDAFVLPSLAEGISNTILEAMASGLPVIATRVGGNAELVDDGTTGTLVPSADTEALARRCCATRAIPDSRRRKDVPDATACRAPVQPGCHGRAVHGALRPAAAESARPLVPGHRHRCRPASASARRRGATDHVRHHRHLRHARAPRHRSRDARRA